MVELEGYFALFSYLFTQLTRILCDRWSQRSRQISTLRFIKTYKQGSMQWCTVISWRGCLILIVPCQMSLVLSARGVKQPKCAPKCFISIINSSVEYFVTFWMFLGYPETAWCFSPGDLQCRRFSATNVWLVQSDGIVHWTQPWL